MFIFVTSSRCHYFAVSSPVKNTELAIHFFLQLAVILLACRLAGIVAKKFGQPQVVAEMVTGILLGPSLFGLFWPDLQQSLFPWDASKRDTQSYLFPVSQLGLAVYMFIVGLEFRVDIMRERFKSSVAVSAAGMVAPFVLGAGLGWVLFNHTSLFPAATGQVQGMIFVGASMCVTAFPVLARLIEHKKLTGTAMGAVSLGAGAVNDAAAWALLAFVLASMTGKWNEALTNIGSGLAYIAVTLVLVKPLLWRLRDRFLSDGKLSDGGLITILILMSVGAWFTDRIGLHAVLGAFVMGVAIPKGIIVRDFVARIQPFTVAVLLPLFFTFSGLNTKIGLLNSGYLWLICAAVLVVAILGKGVACWLAARATGISNREALGIGTLMNVRGLMELIMLNIGLEKGIISEGLFAILVIMAVVTTLMASPIFDLLAGKSVAASGPAPEPAAAPSET
jgi:Kef-type K+ transport system membrane component KefB